MTQIFGMPFSWLPALTLAVFIALIQAVAAGPGCPRYQKGVLALHNRYRSVHQAPPLAWDAKLAAKAQAWADRCKWGHADGRTLAGSGESIYSSHSVKYPHRGMDVCTYATWALYLEVTSYAYGVPGTSRDGVEIGHFVNIVWGSTTKLGCGYRHCPNGMDFVVCRYSPGFYASGGSNSTHRAYAANVRPTKCQASTFDPWCSSCTRSGCTACYERPNYGQPMGREEIRLDGATRRCVSKCPSSVPHCAACMATNRCIRCDSGFAFDEKRRCVRTLGRGRKPGTARGL